LDQFLEENATVSSTTISDPVSLNLVNPSTDVVEMFPSFVKVAALSFISTFCSANQSKTPSAAYT
jgi:hypothetical protein